MHLYAVHKPRKIYMDSMIHLWFLAQIGSITMNDAGGHFPTSTSIHQPFRQLCTLEIVSPFTLYLNWQLIIYELQLWRLVRIQ